MTAIFKSSWLKLVLCSWTLVLGILAPFAGLVLPQVNAAQYFLDESDLLFNFTDGYSVTDYTAEYNAAQPASLQVDKYLLIGADTESGTGVFEVYLSSEDPAYNIEQIQLRSINTETKTNRELLGRTGVELVGSSFVDDLPRQALVLGLRERTLVILYRGMSEMEYESFLLNINQSGDFVDIASHPLSPEILDVVSQGIFKGYVHPETKIKEFRPESGINRAEFIKVLVLAAPDVSQAEVEKFYSEYTEDLADPVFLDVDRDAWFAAYIFFAYERGWVRGYPDGSFRPADLVNIAEAVKIIVSSRNVEVPANAEVWYQPYLEYFVEQGVLESFEGGHRFVGLLDSFLPHESCSRAQIAGFLSRL